MKEFNVCTMCEFNEVKNEGNICKICFEELIRGTLE